MAEKKTGVGRESYTEEKKVEIRVLPVDTGSRMYTKAGYETENSLMSSCSIGLTIDVNEVTSRAVDVWKLHFKDEATAAREWFEVKMNLEKGALDVGDVWGTGVRSSYWRDPKAKIVCTKVGAKLESATLRLDLSVESDYILYLIALYHVSIAPTWNKREDNSKYKLAIYDPSVQNEEALDEIGKFRMCFKQLDGYAEAGESLKLYVIYSLLRSQDKSYMPQKLLKLTSGASEIFAELKRAMDSRSQLNTIHGILRDISEANLSIYSELYKAAELGLVYSRSNVWYTKEGEKMGDGIAMASHWLTKGENSSLRTIIASQHADKLKQKK